MVFGFIGILFVLCLRSSEGSFGGSPRFTVVETAYEATVKHG